VDLADWNLLNVVHALYSSVGLGVLREADKTESTATTSVAILDHGLDLVSVYCEDASGKNTNSLLNLTKLLELGAKSRVVSVPCKAAAREC